jgi:hypothetical protein
MGPGSPPFAAGGTRRRTVVALKTLLAFGLLTGLVADGATASAQVEPPEEPAEASTVETGEDAFSVAGFGLLGRVFGRAARPLQAGWYLVPSITLTGEFDDRATTPSDGGDAESDFIGRGAFTLGTHYIARRLTLIGAYVREGEVFARESDLNNFGREGLSLDVRYTATPLLVLTLGGSYRKAEDTRDVRTETGVPAIEVEDRESSVLRAASSAAYDFSALTKGDVDYVFTRSEVENSSTETGHELSLRLGRVLTALSRGSVGYRVGLFESDQAESITFHTVLLGYGRRLGPNTDLGIEVGPSFSEVGTDVSGSIRYAHRFRRSTLSIAYLRDQSIVAGLAGARTTDQFTAGLGLELARSLDVGLAGSVARVSGQADPEATDTTLYSAGVRASYRLSPWAKVDVSYRFALEENGETISRHVVAVSVDFGFPIRIMEP